MSDTRTDKDESTAPGTTGDVQAPEPVEVGDRYSRPDVPRQGHHRTAKAVVILLVIACAVGCVGWFAWSRANADSSMGDHDLADALTQTVAATSEEAQTQTQAVASSDEFTNILVLTVDDPDSSSPTLEGVRLLVLDTTQGWACLATLPPDLLVAGTDGTTQTLQSLYAEQGASACVTPVAQVASTSLSHAVVMSTESWDELWDLVGSGASTQTLVSKASGILSSLRTDMDVSSLLEVFQQVQGVGSSNVSTYEAEGVAQEGGTSVDAQAFGLAVGTLVATE